MENKFASDIESRLSGKNNGTSTIVNVKEASQNVINTVGGFFNFDKEMTVEEALKESGNDFVVEKRPLVYVTPELIQAIKNGEPVTDIDLSTINILDQMATIRTDNGHPFGAVGKDYTPVQNSKALDFINFFLSGLDNGGKKPIIETAGCLNGGARMFIEVKMPEGITLDGGDQIDNKILFTTSHDGSGGVMAMFTPIRVICQNTLNMAIRGSKNKITYRHTTRVNEHLDFTMEENRKMAVETMGMLNLFTKSFVDNLLHMKSLPVNADQVNEFAATMVLSKEELEAARKSRWNVQGMEISTRKKNLVHDLLEAIEGGVGQEMHRGTGLWLLNGWTTYLGNGKRFSNEESKFNSVIFGDGLKKTQMANDWVLANL